MNSKSKPAAKTLARGAAHISIRLIFSYVFDWICILAIAGVGGAFNKLHYTSKRVFSLQDPSISYPYKPDTVSVTVMVLVGFVAPLVITFVLTFLFVPGPAAARGTPRALVWRRKLWEWNTAWLGLGLALASAFMITEGLKDLAGKPRPHMLAACRPNLDLIAQYQVGGLGTQLNGGAVPIMVDYHICQETDPQALRDMFASWPSGHSSFSWAGLLYLSLWVSSKFAVTIPILNLAPKSNPRGRPDTPFNKPSNVNKTPTVDGRDSSSTEHEDRHGSLAFYNEDNPPRNQAAAPPVYLLILVFVPIGTAAFIAVSRWFDYHHHGIDILTGSILGAFTAWFSFRFYHMPIRRGAGWSWGARSRGNAFWRGVGQDTYVGSEGWKGKKYSSQVVHEQTDVESGKIKTQENSQPGPSAM